MGTSRERVATVDVGDGYWLWMPKAMTASEETR
jgi:hypothetical protein